jgi:hypothetical protein
MTQTVDQQVLDQIAVGDRVKACFDRDGAEYEITGPVSRSASGLMLGSEALVLEGPVGGSLGPDGRLLRRPGVYLVRIIEHTPQPPEWHEAPVIRATVTVPGVNRPAIGIKNVLLFWADGVPYRFATIDPRITSAEVTARGVSLDWLSDVEVPTGWKAVT